MKRASCLVSRPVIVGCAALSILAPQALQLASAAPANVYVICEKNYKTDADGDSFNNGANAEAFKAAGFFGAGGEIFRVVGNDVKRGGQVVGAVVRNMQGAILYYKNPNDSVRVYPISAGPSTVNDAWLALADMGTLTIATHGGRGTMVLDGNKKYQGFKCAGTESTGTGRTDLEGNQPPVALTPRKITATVDLNGCLTLDDPDEAGPQRSVVSTALDVCGVSTATGNSGLVIKETNVLFNGDEEKKKAAIADLAKKAGGQAKLGTYFAANSITKLLEVGAQLEDTHGIIVKFRSTKTRPPAPSSGSELGVGDTLVAQVTTALVLDEVGPSGGVLVYPRSPEPAIYTLDIPAGATSSILSILLHPGIVEDSLWPVGERPAATPVRFGPYPDDPWTLGAPATLTIRVDDPKRVTGFYFVVDNTMFPMPFDANTSESTISAEVSEAGVYAVFEVPPPCTADANVDGIVDGADLSVLLAQFGASVAPGTGADFNADGVVNVADLSILLANFYNAC